MADEEPTYRRAHVLYFTEEISMVETLEESRHTLFCLQTKICVYARNGRDLVDVIHCCRPQVYSACAKTLSFSPVVACLFSSVSGIASFTG